MLMGAELPHTVAQGPQRHLLDLLHGGSCSLDELLELLWGCNGCQMALVVSHPRLYHEDSWDTLIEIKGKKRLQPDSRKDQWQGTQ